MNSFTCIGRGHGAPCVPATERAWQQARQSPQLAALCKQIENCQDADEQKRLKDRLPVWTPRCGEFQNDHRAERDALAPLNRQMFDIDQKGCTDQILALMKPKVSEVQSSKVSNPETLKPAEGDETLKPDMYIGPFLILQVEESVRRGTHVLVVPPSGTSLNDAQSFFSQLINLPVDPAVKNVAGCIYMVPEDHVRYQSPKFFEAEVLNAEVFTDNSRVSSGEPVESIHDNSRSNEINSSNSSKEFILSKVERCSFPQDYDGIPYSILVEALAEQLGGVPVHGSRNNFLFSMACHLRYVCNDDARWIMSVLPTYGEERSRVERTVQSAINRAQSRQMPALVQRAISVARSRAAV